MTRLSGKKTIAQILSDYKQYKNQAWRGVLNYYSGLPSLKDVLNEAGQFHKSPSCCDEHQRRIKKESKNTFATNLQKDAKNIAKAADFNDLYRIISSIAPKGIAELTVYDTTMRIGSYLENGKGRGVFKPKDVYLHNGAWKGAKALYKTGRLVKLQKRMPLSAFSKFFSGCQAWEVEEILCIYENNFS